MDRVYLLAPALLGVAFMLVMLAVYSVLCVIGRVPEVTGLERRRFTEIFGPFMVRYMLWLIQPIEWFFLASRISPNFITATSLLLCACSGIAIATAHMATGAWLYALAGILDILDGRMARATGKQGPAGALFDSVADRWGELFVFSGFAWLLRGDGWLLAVMLAVAGSMMVSYTRARGEGLGLKLDGGMMQRAERIVLVSVGTLVSGWFMASPASAHYASPAAGIALAVCGAGASFTAVGRWIAGYRMLAATEPTVEPVEVRRRGAVRDAEPAVRITGEHSKHLA